jgi:hypothetical protein
MADLPKTETLARATVAAVPYIGGAVGEIVFGHRDRTKQRRLAEFIEDISRRLHDVEKSTVNADYLESEEFADFLEAVLERATRVRAEAKRERLSRALCRQIIHPIPLDFGELFLDLVVELNESQVRILSEHDQGSASQAGASFRTPRHYSLRQGQYRYFVQILISRGLMLELHVPKTGIGEKYKPFERLEVTELGKEFLKFLHHGDGRTKGCSAISNRADAV